ncbi:MAG: bacillithiol biosynthesis cysteine-adding enzyme BshC [Gemmatimonadetes bacterium]|nr:bacillithiol biosynthesis cysteine-adding enzyme BshC [Gemmatimonadota bacterium]
MITFVDTPLLAEVSVPAQRPGGIAPALLAALSTPVGSSVASKLADPRVLVVTTGQQPGLFTGALYTIHKALSARALAIHLERAWSRPVVPVFWSAADDHDYPEATRTTWLGLDGSLVSASLPPRPADAPQRSMGQEPLPEAAFELLDRLQGDLPDGPARDHTIGWLRRHYRVGATLGGAFGGAMAELLGPLGIAWFDPAHPAARLAAKPVIRTALERAEELDRLLAGRLRELEGQGLAPDVKVGDGATLVFADSESGRDRLVATQRGLQTRRAGTALTLADATEALDRSPDRFTPNVLLRPVVESALLPTVAYLAGPGELRYLRLAEALYRPLAIERQTPVPRWSGILVEPRVARAVEKFRTSVGEIRTDARAVESRVLRSVVPPDFEPAFAQLRADLESGYQRLGAVADAIDPTVARPVANALSGALGQVADLEKRLLAAQKRRQSELLGQFDRARAAIMPMGKEQERVIGLPALIGRYGLGLIGDLAAHIEAWYGSALEGRPATP